MLTAFWVMKEPIRIGSHEKGATVNSASNCQPLEQNLPYLLHDSNRF